MIAEHFDNITPAQRVQRWENVLRVLQEMTTHERRNHFDMNYWGRKTPCGTVGCAAGHCGLDPWFRRRGFKMDFMEGGEFNYYFSGASVPHFFGYSGYSSIFLDTVAGYISTVRNVKGEIKRLKALVV